MLAKHIAVKLLGAVLAVGVIGACAAMVPDVVEPDAPVSDASFTSPLDEFIGQAVWNNQEEFRRASDEFAVMREQLIAQCMRDAGFNYQPDLNSDWWSIGTNAFDDIHPDNRQWVSQYGFGIVSGHRFRQGGTIFDVRDDDPNVEYVARLSDIARDAFELALNGPAINPQPPLNSHGAWEDWMRTRGCRGQAIVQAQADNPLFLRQSDEFTQLFEAIGEMHNNMIERPEMVTLNSEWSHCMADAGHIGLGSPGEAESRLLPEYFETSFSVLQLQAAGQDVERAAILAPLQTREIDLALADLDCRDATNYRGRVNAIMLQAESQFVADNRTLLEDFRNASE